MNRKILQHKNQIAILLSIFILYLLIGIGALDISYYTGIHINFNSNIFASTISNTLIDPLRLGSLNLLCIFLTGLLLSLVLPLLTPIYAAAITLLSCAPQIYINSYNTGTNLTIPMEYNLLMILSLFSINALLIYFIETHSRVRIVNLFGQYVPPEIVSEICKQPKSINMDGESREMTVLFCDLQDFTSISERLEAKQVTQLLNEYFDNMTEILYQHGATIDKYIGDAIMAFWSAPVVQEDHAQRAVLAAFQMQEKIKHVSESFIQRGWPGPPMGIGINSGDMNVGNMGSRYRVVYTVIGDAVNLASRIEALTRIYQVPIIVSESTMQDCNNIVFREIDTVQVKGKKNLTRIFQPFCMASMLDDKTKSFLEHHQEGIEAYTNKDLGTAKKIFRALKEDHIDDGYYPAILKLISQA